MAKGRFARINLDGKSVSKTKIIATGAAPGQLLQLLPNNTSGLFAGYGVAGKRDALLYVAHPLEHEGLQSADAIPVSSTVVGELAENGRELAVLVAATSALQEDTPLTSNGAGLLRIAVLGTDDVIAYSQEVITVGAAPELVKVRFA